MTQLELAKEGIISPQMEKVAQREGIAVETVRQSVALGSVAITPFTVC